MQNKFNIGDEVKIIRNNNNDNSYIGKTGIINIIYSNGCYPYGIKDIPFGWCCEELELVKPATKEPQSINDYKLDKLIITSNTQKEWNRVLELLEKRGVMWYDGDRPTVDKGKYVIDDNNSLRLNGNINGFSSLNCYKSEKVYQDYTFITAKEFLGEEPVCAREIVLEMQRELQEAYWYLANPFKVGYLKENNKQVKVKKQNIMTSIVKFAKDLTLSKDEKLLRKVDLQDENGEWTNSAYDIVQDLEAKARGFKNMKALDNKYDGDDDLGVLSVFEADTLFTKFEKEILEIATKFEKEIDKK